jgi:excinuclease ABC subunit B
MYADTMTDSMRRAIDETNRRRLIQEAHNNAHGITPQGIQKAVKDINDRVKALAEERATYTASTKEMSKDDILRVIKDLERQMKEAAHNLEFEKAALYRDEMLDLRKLLPDR